MTVSRNRPHAEGVRLFASSLKFQLQPSSKAQQTIGNFTARESLISSGIRQVGRSVRCGTSRLRLKLACREAAGER
jgi:hypothetical protein